MELEGKGGKVGGGLTSARKGLLDCGGCPCNVTAVALPVSTVLGTTYEAAAYLYKLLSLPPLGLKADLPVLMVIGATGSLNRAVGVS